jgi:serine/threonine-protein phosphatase 2A regulatory subunit A
VLQRLRQAEWFTPRVSVCGLFAVTYPKADPEVRAEMRTLFKELSRDETPMVRRAVAANVGPFAAAAEPRDVQTALLPIMQHLLVDDQESVRKLALDGLPALAKGLAGADCVRDVLDLFCGGVLKDPSWRVRHAVTARLPDMAEAFGPDLSAARLVKPFVERLQVCVQSHLRSLTDSKRTSCSMCTTSSAGGC